SGIQSAEILRFSQYDVPESLIKKLEYDESLDVYDFYRYDDNILNYYLECYKANNDPFLHKGHLIPGIDLAELVSRTPYHLSVEQQKTLIKEIYHKDYKAFFDYQLVISEFSIDLTSKGKFVVAYRRLQFDPVEKTLHLESTTRFNASFYIEKAKHTLSYYTDISPRDFESIYAKDRNEAFRLIADNFKKGELLNTRPEIVVLGYRQIDISRVYDTIAADHHN